MSHKKTRYVYEKALQYEKLYEAWNTVLHTCQNKQGLFEFALFSHAKVMGILMELWAREYHPSAYRCFMIFEPKPRLVMSQSIKDKTVNHFVAKEYLLPLLEPSLIDMNVATRKGMGSKKAHAQMAKYIAELMILTPGMPIYELTIDVSKYFYMIDHEILFEKLEKKIKDKDVVEILRRIVSETNKPYINKTIDRFNKQYGVKIVHYEQNKGLSIGAMTSQFLAIFYLNDLDHFIKEELKCKYYMRYMDDFVILSHDKEWLCFVKREIERELLKLKLKINPKSAVYKVTSSTGMPFLGLRYRVDKRGRLRVVALAKTVRRIKKRLRWLRENDYEKYLLSYESYRGYFAMERPFRGIERIAGLKDDASASLPDKNSRELGRENYKLANINNIRDYVSQRIEPPAISGGSS